MKKVILIYICIILLFSAFGCVKPSKNEGGNKNDEPIVNKGDIVFFDDFNGNTLSSYWNWQIGDGSDYGILGWGNSEKQYYKSENTAVSNGSLKITAKAETTKIGSSQLEYTSSRISTKGKIGVKYGRIEARIKMPSGEGIWPAFWMLPEDNEYGGWPYSGEIDIMEARGRLTNQTTSALHYADERGNHRYDSTTFNIKDNGKITDFHIYALEWTEGRIKWFFDDTKILDISSFISKVGTNVNAYPAPFDKEFYLLLNMAVGGHFDGHRLPPPNSLPAVMEVDFVRVTKLID